MFDGPHQVLFYALPPNSQLLFSEPGNAPLFEDFDRPVGPRGCVVSKSWIKQNFLRIWFLRGHFYKKYPNFDLWFSPLPGTGSDPIKNSSVNLRWILLCQKNYKGILGQKFWRSRIQHIFTLEFFMGSGPGVPPGPSGWVGLKCSKKQKGTGPWF